MEWWIQSAGRRKAEKQMTRTRSGPNEPSHQLIEEAGIQLGLYKNH
jgi:hypothetical protein